jgi:dihydroxyacetone kinase-like protein
MAMPQPTASSDALTKRDIVAAVRHMAAVFDGETDALCRLDAAVGDGDHGLSMARGFRTAAERLPGVQDLDIGAIAGMVGAALAGGIGGVTGPIFGTLFLRLGAEAQGKEQLEVADLARAFRGALDAIRALGGAQPGDKTMVDALAPVVEVLERAAAEALLVQSALDRAAGAADEGARATIGMRATIGRARYLGERSIGHQDPGATSFALIMRALSDSYRADHSAGSADVRAAARN